MSEKSLATMRREGKFFEALEFAIGAIVAIHLPSLGLFLFEPNYRTRDGFYRFWFFPIQKYFAYILNQLDLFVLMIALLGLIEVVQIGSQRRIFSMRIILAAYVVIATIVYGIRCFGGLGGLRA